MALTALQNRNTPENLVLKNREGQEVVLTPAKLERWLAASENMTLIRKPNPLHEDPAELEKDSFMATQFISRFGFKKPGDLITFLKSPGGEATLSLIGEQLAIIAEQEEEREFQFREEQAMHARLFSSMMLKIIYKKDEKDHALRDLMQAEIDRVLNKPEVTSVQGTSSTPQIDSSKHLIAHYDRAAASLQSQLTERHEFSKVLEAQMAMLDEHSLAIDKKHDNLDLHMNAMLGMIKKEPTPEEIDAKIKELTKKIDKQMDDVQRHIENGDDELAHQIVRESNALNVQIAMLKDLSDVNSKKSVLFTLKGEETNSFEADFIIPKNKAEDFKLQMKDKQFVKDPEDGQYYLLNKNQNLKDLTPEERLVSHEAGKKLFKSLDLHPEAVMNVQKLVHHNKGLEHSDNNNKKSKLSESSQKLAEEMNILTDLLRDVQDARLKEENNLKQAMAQGKAPTPSPTANTKMSPMPDMPTFTGPRPANLQTASKNLQFLTESYRHMILLMKNGITEQALTGMRNGLTPFAQVKRPGTESTLDILNRTRPGQPIPPNDLQKMLKGLDQLQKDLMKEFGPMKQPKPEKEKEKVFNPTPSPFKM